VVQRCCHGRSRTLCRCAAQRVISDRSKMKLRPEIESQAQPHMTLAIAGFFHYYANDNFSCFDVARV
ncbi:MAG TPA: hypothetical protein VHV58_06960, partial [Pseudolabrys sp.]|nr:hypothetical protein [Pseudolabrys sp.]